MAEEAILLAGALHVAGQVEDLEAQLLTRLRLEPMTLGVFHGDLKLGIIDLVDDGHVLEEVDRAGLFVVASFKLTVRTKGALGRGEDGLFGGLHKHRSVNALFLADQVDDA